MSRAERFEANATGVLVRRLDGLGRVAYAPTERSGQAAHRFRTFQQALIEAAGGGGPAMLAAHLIAFEAVVTPSDLWAALSAAPDVYLWRGQLCLEWSRADGWRDRRALSGATRCVLRDCVSASVADAPRALAAFAREAVPRWAADDDAQILQQLFESAQLWAALHLPGMLAAHVLRDVALQPLPRSALAREERGLMLASGDDHDNPPYEQITCLEGALVAGASGDLALVDRLARRCVRAPAERQDYSRGRAALLRDIRPWIGEARAAGWVTSVIHGWVWDLIESGTRRQTALAPATIANYVGAAARELGARLASLPALPCDAETLRGIYQDVIDALSPGNRVNAASGLTTFHLHLVRWFDVEPLPHRLHESLEEAPPRANVIWPHEIERVWSWLRSGSGDVRLRDALVLAFRLAWSVRLRTHELMTLRLRNVVDMEGEIEVYPLRRDGPGKSASAVRLMMLDGEANATLQAWIQRRRNEGAVDEDLLFGDPYQPKCVYRHGAMIAAMSTLLRRATGDADVVFHTLSHTWISTQVERLDTLLPGVDMNPLDVVSTGAGHFSPASLRSYVHIIEDWLRRELDSGIENSLRVSSSVAARYTGESAARLRKRASRAHAVSQGYWWAINPRVDCAQWPPASAGLELCELLPPAWLTTAVRQDAELVANVLCDVAQGTAPASVAERAGCAVAEVIALVRTALRQLQTIGLWQPRRRLATLTDELAVIEFVAWGQGPQRIRLSSRHQPRFDAVRRQLPKLNSPPWTSWVEGFRRSYLGLTPEHAGPLFQWLSRANVPPLNLAISSETFNETKAKGEATDRALQGVFRVAFGVPPRLFRHERGEGRPARYLLWSSRTIGDARPPPAACSLHGLHAWMLAVSCLAPPADAGVMSDEELAPNDNNQDPLNVRR